MPAPRPSIEAITEANAGRPSGAARATSSVWPIATPISAPTSVATIATHERNRIQSRMIAMKMPISSPTGASCSDPTSISMPRAANCTPLLLARLARGDQRLAVGLLDLARIEVVADVDGGQAAVGRELRAFGERVADLRRRR